MKKLTCVWICLVMVCAIMQDEVWSQLSEPSFKLEKVIGKVYVGRQAVPLNPILGTAEGTYMMTNLYVVASEDRSELVLIDIPGLTDLPETPAQFTDSRLMQPFFEALKAEFPGAEIKAVFLTHGHVDHCWSIPYFISSGIPVYASSDEVYAPPPLGDYDVPLFYFAIPYWSNDNPINPIMPGDSIIMNDGAVFKAVDLSGHTPGHMGYAYYPDGDSGKINWFFTGDALLSRKGYEVDDDLFNITYLIRSIILDNDTYDFESWQKNLIALKGMLTKRAKLFPAHGAIREGYFWKDPFAYINYTVTTLQE